MPTFDGDREIILSFKVGDRYLFIAFFDQDDLFDALKEYYNSDVFRYEVLEDDLNQVRHILDEWNYDLQVEENLREFSVVPEKGEDYIDTLRNSVMKKDRGSHVIILMNDELSVQQAVRNGANCLMESEIDAAV